MRNIVYISGKISGTDDYMERFAEAEKELREHGYKEIINPAIVNSNLPKSTTYQEYMKMSLCMIDIADIVFFLDGWEQSLGAITEFKYSECMGKKQLFQAKGGK